MMALAHTFRFAIADSFLDAFAKIPRAQQKKVNELVRKFRTNPTDSSINYEKIHSFRDPNLRTVRVSSAYRAVVLKPATGNVYVLLWVDHHDEAMAWAKNKRCIIHPETGSLQIFATEIGVEVVAEPPSSPVDTPVEEPTVQDPLFATYSDADLTSIGVPTELLAEVRRLRSMEELDAVSLAFPPDAFEALFFLADGEPLKKVREAMGIEVGRKVDPEDFEAALEAPVSQGRFALVTDDVDVDAMLDAPLEKWRVFLHPRQRRMVTAHYRGPARVLGGAGTGKTVVAMHRARYLATEVFTGENDRILFTTFTKNLANDIQQNLRKLCSPKVQRRIEVVHLDEWVAGFLKGQGYGSKIVYWPSPSLKPLWDDAMALRPAGFRGGFFREEWDAIVQPEGCASWEDYRKVRRTGRGVRLSRKQRKEIWPVFRRYRELLDAKGLRESVGAMRDAVNLLEHRPLPSVYRSILVDEAQDMSTVAFRVLRQILPLEQANDLFIVGDGHQRIYRRKVVLRHAGVNIVGRSKKLYINYRTTDEIRAYAVALLENTSIDDLDGGVDTNSKYKSLVHGRAPLVRPCASFQEEVAEIVAFVKRGEVARTCLVARTNGLVDAYETALKEAGLETYRLSRSKAEEHQATGLRLATMHRVKGLEFDRLVIAGVNEKTVPLMVGDLKSDDAAVREEAEKRERALLYVAVTRARREVLITSNGKPSPWLAEAVKTCPKCGEVGLVSETFGYRKLKRTKKDGSEVVVERAQSYCRGCR